SVFEPRHLLQSTDAQIQLRSEFLEPIPTATRRSNDLPLEFEFDRPTCRTTVHVAPAAAHEFLVSPGQFSFLDTRNRFFHHVKVPQRPPTPPVVVHSYFGSFL